MDASLTGFEQTMARLEDILEKMSGDDIALEESIELYASAAELIAKSDGALKAAQVRIDEIDDRLAALEPEDEE